MVIPQLTPWSCAAASTVDALVDLLGSDPRAAELAQTFLIERLKLRTQASPLEWVAEEVHRWLGDHVNVRLGSIPLGQAVAEATFGAGVVVGLAPRDATGSIGHAVRLEGGDGVLDRGGSDISRAILSRGDERLADGLGFHAFVFDPAAQGRRIVVPMGTLRERFERWGSQALLLYRK